MEVIPGVLYRFIFCFCAAALLCRSLPYHLENGPFLGCFLGCVTSEINASGLIDDLSLTSGAPFVLVSSLGNKSCGEKDRHGLERFLE